MGRLTFRLLLAAIIVVCSAIAAVWALMVPPFQEPDEISHLDYAFALYDVGRPFRVSGAVAGSEVTPQVRYLDALSHFRTMRYNPLAREPAQYASTTFLHWVDAGAPEALHRVPRPGSPMPYVMFGYPVGYYTALAGVMCLADALSRHSLLAVFFCARAFNVTLLAITLGLAAAVFRHHALDRSTTLLATITLGTLPLTSWVAGYAQPDNLSLLLVTATLYSALRWRARASWLGCAMLCLLLVALFFTKHQYAIAAWLAVTPFAAARCLGRPRQSVSAAKFALMALVPLSAFAASLCVTPVSRLSAMGPFVQGRLEHASAHGTSVGKLAQAVFLSAINVYGGGSAFDGYWLGFGSRGAHIFSGTGLQNVRYALVIISLTTVMLFASTQYRLLKRIATVGRRRSVTAALLLITSAFAVNLYTLVTLMLLAIQATSNGDIELQGRYWLPIMVPTAVIVFVYLPKFYRRREQRRSAVRILAGTMACYSIVASIAAMAAMRTDFYQAPKLIARRDTFARVVTIQAAGQRPQAIPGMIVVPRGRAITVRGYAVDMVTGLPAIRVSLAVDRGPRRYAKTRLQSFPISQYLHDDAIRASGFNVQLSPKAMMPGLHRLRLEIDDPELVTPLPIGWPIDVNVVKPRGLRAAAGWPPARKIHG